jgi:prepilin signal peptidase PulO-like enzyme (type II secretory pathway)
LSEMEQPLILTMLFVLGLCMGSFAGATVWRLRARQLVQDKADGEVVDKKEYVALLPLTKATVTTDRSRCLHCGHELSWYDLLPLVSWASTGGTCRYCHKKIGNFEPLIEISVAVFFIASYVLWPEQLQTPLALLQFGLWLVAGVLLAVLFAYDLKWFILPDRIVFLLIGVAAVIAALQLVESPDVASALISLGMAGALLSGLYLILWHISKGTWIGFGDIKLGLGLALLLGKWELAFLTLFLANFIGCMIVLPGLATGKLNRSTPIPFGPLLIVGGVIAALVGQAIVKWFLTAFS